MDCEPEKQTGFIRTCGKDDAIDNPLLNGTQPDIAEGTNFDFAAFVNGLLIDGSEDTIVNDNVWKNIKGLGGMFQLDANTNDDVVGEDPVAGEHLIIMGPESKRGGAERLGDAWTDQHGWYFAEFSATGKRSEYNVYWDQNGNDQIDPGEPHQTVEMGGSAGKWAGVTFLVDNGYHLL